MAEISAQAVKELRQRTGAGIMDCKQALTETNGDFDKAIEALRVKLQGKLNKLASRDAAEGIVHSYIHATGKVGVLVEINCNTDFVARNEDFTTFAHEVAKHIAASPDIRYVNVDEIPAEKREAELKVFQQQAEDKPENIRAKIAEGKLQKWFKEVVLLEQQHFSTEKHDGKTIDQLRADLSTQTGENIVIRRFARFAVGDEVS